MYPLNITIRVFWGKLLEIMLPEERRRKERTRKKESGREPLFWLISKRIDP